MLFNAPGLPEFDCYIETGVKKPDIAKQMARRAGLSPAEAADCLDRVIHQIVLRLKRGQDAGLPGLGVLRQSARGELRLDREEKRP